MAESTRSRLTSDDEFWDMKPTDSQTSDNILGGVSVWCYWDNVFRLTDNVREGDKLELVNSNLPHLHCWAIYKSSSKLYPFHWTAVLFFNGANEERGAYSKRNTFLNVSFQGSKNVIIATSILKFLLKPGNKVRINNFKDKDWSPLGTGHICEEVTYQLKEAHKTAAGEEVYVCKNQFKDSEDFVNHCRYDGFCQHNWRRHNNYGRVSEWYSKATLGGFIHEVRVGDRLEFRGSFPYERWGIYIGQWGDDLEQVVLFAHGDKTNSATSTERLNPNLCVKSILIHVVDGHDQVRINNGDDWKWPPLDRENILKEINSQLAGKARTLYKCRVSFKDSEGFVNYCRYDYWRFNFRLVSDWCDYPFSLPDLQVGDRLEFHRTALPYTHWGIYVGDWGDGHNQVVHFAPANGNGKIFSKKKSSGSGSFAKDQPVLKVNHIKKVLGNDKVRLNNEKDHIWPPFVRTDILDEIERQLKSQSNGHKLVYNLFSNNCEHFVNHCRYGRHRSDQVTPFSRIRDRATKGQ